MPETGIIPASTDGLPIGLPGNSRSLLHRFRLYAVPDYKSFGQQREVTADRIGAGMQAGQIRNQQSAACTPQEFIK